jgi:hypothetical protein
MADDSPTLLDPYYTALPPSPTFLDRDQHARYGPLVHPRRGTKDGTVEREHVLAGGCDAPTVVLGFRSGQWFSEEEEE